MENSVKSESKRDFSSAEELLRVSNLTVSYPIAGGLFVGSKKLFNAVDGVSFSIRRGEILGLVGESGSGKTTIVRELLRRIPQLEFSISATSRAPRGTERDGVDYYFLSQEEFAKAVAENRFVEWEEVYKGACYGTLRSEVERIWAKGHVIVFDVDVIGGINLKRIFGDDACSVFIMPPSIEELRRRLVGRGTDAPAVIERRVAKAEFELTKAPEFDHVVVNDCLEEAVGGTCGILDQFIAR